MRRRGWRLTPRGVYWLIELPLCVLIGVVLAAAAYFGASGGF